MKSLKVALAVACAVVVGWAFTASADIPASAYVQNGLIAHWDGIENLLKDGVRQHDGESTVWSDLTGNGHDFDLSSYIGTQIDGFTTKSLRAKSCWNVPCANPVNVTNTKDYKTIEIFAKHNGLYQCLFNSGDGLKKFVAVMRDSVQFYNVKNANYGIGNGDAFQAACVHDPKNDATFTVYVNGEMAEQTASDTWSVNSYATCLGRGISDNYKFTGEYYAIRLYSRALTADEIAVNANIDKMRFEGADSADLTWPDGYRFSADNQRLEAFLVVAGADGATISFDNEAFETATNGWFALNQSVTVYAKPVTGQAIAAWTGLPSDAQVSDDKTAATFTLTGPMSVAAVSHAPMTLCWRGTKSEFASDAANWAKENGEAAALPPISGDAVVLDGDSESMVWDIRDVKPASWTQTVDFKGTAMLMVGTRRSVGGSLAADGLNRELYVTGDVTIDGGYLTCGTNYQIRTTTLESVTSNEGDYRLWLTAGGDITVGTGATVDVSRCGFYYGIGSGYHSGAGSHGGMALNDGVRDYKYCFGNLFRPAEIGSGGESGYGNLGAGAVKITAGGTLTVNGAIDATPSVVKHNGIYASYYGAGGGSVWLTAARMAGTGLVAANGGPSDKKNQGSTSAQNGGGRMAFYLTDPTATFDDLGWTVECFGSRNNGELTSCRPGTIYRQLAADEDEHGELMIVGTDLAAPGRTVNDATNYTYCTPLKSEGTSEFRFRQITLKGAATLGIIPGSTLDLTDTTISGSTGKYQDAIILAGGTLKLPGDAYDFTNVQLWSVAPSVIKFLSDDGLGTLSLHRDCRFDCPIGIPGSLVVVSNKIYHTAQSVAYKRFWIEIATTNDLTVLAKGQISGDAAGFAGASSPGYGGVNAIGGSYGGMGYGATLANCYGDPRDPQECGSAGHAAGGGLVKLFVSGTLDVAGIVSVNGGGGGYYASAGSGGAVNLTVNRLTGGGRIRAGGGCTYPDGIGGGYGICPYTISTDSTYAGGGGGRIAIRLTGAGEDFASYTGTYETPGSSPHKNGKRAGNGTIYLRTPDQALDEGTLIIDAMDPQCKPAEGLGAGIHPKQDGITVGRVEIRKWGALQLQRNCTLNVKGDFANDSTGVIVGDLGDSETPQGTVAFVDAARESRITGTNEFSRLFCAVPGKTLRFGGEGSLCRIVTSGLLDIRGEEETPIYLRGPVDGTYWNLAMEGSAPLAYADVRDSDARHGAMVAVDETNVDSKHNENWNFVSITPGETITWTGAADGSWANAANWDLHRTPVDTDNVVVESDTDFSPELSVPITVLSLSVAEGTELRLNGNYLTVANGLSVLGRIVCSGAEVISAAGDVTIKGFVKAQSVLTLDGSASQSVDLGGLDFHIITVGGTMPAVSFADGFSSDFFVCEKRGAPFTMTFAAGKTVKVSQLALDGVQPNESAGLTLLSSAAASSWNLNVTGKASVIGVIVSDGNSVTPIVAMSPSVDGSRNRNWTFGAVKSVWQGANGGSWSDGGNWSAQSAPDENTVVSFESDAQVALDADARALLVEVGAAKVTLTGSKPLSIASYLEVQSGGTLVQAMTNEAEIAVGGNVFVRNGGVWTHQANGVNKTQYGVDQGFGVRATVSGDVLVDAGGKITAYGCGFRHGYGPGCNNPTYGTSYAARYGSGALAGYGSMFCPTDLGSGGHSTYGREAGGRIRLTVAGTLTVNGEIGAEGVMGGCYNGTGGSVWLTVGELAGAGVIQADGAMDAAGSTAHAGLGGRVAIYLTGDGDFSGFTGKITAHGGFEENTETPSTTLCGTVYLKEKAKHGTVYLRNCGSMVSSCTGGVDLPVTNLCPDSVNSYKETTFDVGEGGALYITRDVTIEELELDSNSRINLNGHTLTIISLKHKNRKGWPTKWAYNDRGIFPGTDADGNPGKIVWMPRGLMIMVK